MTVRLRLLLCLSIGAIASWPAVVPVARAQMHNGVELVQARLIADSETVAPGRPVTLGLHLKMAPGWHTYWEYSGDAGLPTRLELTLPDGFRATPIQWPLPQRFTEEGGIETYGYKEEVLLMVRLFPPATLGSDEVEIRAAADWLVCEVTCFPGSAELSLALPVAESIRPANADLFDRFQRQLPRPLRAGAGPGIEWERRGRQLVLAVTGAEGKELEFFPLPSADVVLGGVGKPAAGRGGAARIDISVTNAPADLSRLPGVLAVTDRATGERVGWRVP